MIEPTSGAQMRSTSQPPAILPITSEIPMSDVSSTISPGLFAIGAGAGPSVLGHAFDASATYAQGLLVCGALLIFSALVLLTLGRYPRFVDAPVAELRVEPIR